MKSNIIFRVFLVLLLTIVHGAFGQSISKSVISSCGWLGADSSGIRQSATVGQFLSGRITSGTYSLSQGYQHPGSVVTPILGVISLCQGTSSTLADSTSGGTWSSSNTSVATIGSSSAYLSGVTAGTSTITYSVAGNYVTTVITVTPSPAAISGPSSVCLGSGITLSDDTTGGTWSSSNTSIATIGSISGIITSVAAGTTIITYAAGGCYVTTLITVNPLPASISGTSPICVGASTTLSDATSGGSWSTSNAGVATIGGTGNVTAISAGTTTISYTLATGCAISFAFTVISTPVLPAITGITSICMGGTTTLSNSVAGGFWYSTNGAVATVSSSGYVTSVSGGSASIVYAAYNACGIGFISALVTVTSPSPITGTTTVCTGASTTLGNSIAGGTWASSNTSVATISSGGAVNGVSAGTSTITYTALGCVVTTQVTVNPVPSAISGTTTVCSGLSTSLSNTISGGIWTSSNMGVATVGSTSGFVLGISIGSAIISYNNTCGGAGVIVTVNSAPSAGAISGSTSLCASSATTLTDGVTGGVWSSSNTSVATIGTSGLVTGISAGTTIISYTVSNSCGASSETTVITVNPLPSSGTIIGAGSLSIGATTTFSSSASGGSWTSSNTTIATVGSGGGVTGVAAGTCIISYTVSNVCGTSYATKVIAISVLCAYIGEVMTTLAGNGSGYTYGGFSGDGGPATAAELDQPLGVAVDSSGNVYIADRFNARIRKVDASGIITTIAGGGTSGLGDGGPASNCSLYNPNSVAFDRSGNLYIGDGNHFRVRKVNASGLISSVAGNGSLGYSGDGGAATASSLTVSGIAIDSVGNIYIADSYNERIRKINTSGIISTIAGNGISGYSGDGGAATNAKLREPNSVTLDASGNIYIADMNNCCIRKVNTSGIITTIAGTGGTCGFSGDGGAATNAHFNNVTGVLCDRSGNLYIADGVNDRVRKIDATGIISTYAGGGSGPYSGWGDGRPATAARLWQVSCLAFDATGNLLIGDGANNRIRKVSISSYIPPIYGNNISCSGIPDTLHDSVSGGVWVSGNPSVAIIGSNTGIVTGLIAGTTDISYITSCGVTSSIMWINSVPDPIVGDSNVCVGATSEIYYMECGGTFTSSNTSVATVMNFGSSFFVTGVASGTATISLTNTCGSTTFDVIVHPLPDSGVISGSSSVCIGGTTTISESVSGGIWSSSDAGMATIDGGGIVTGITLGTTIISYTVSNTCGTSSAIDTITINDLPGAGIISGAVTMSIGGTIVLSDTTTGGIWSSDNTDVAIIGTNGLVSGISPGTAIITYMVTNSCGAAYATDLVTVSCSMGRAIITTIAGTGIYGYSGDGAAATMARLYYPSGVAVDGAGNIYIADENNNVVRKLSPSGTITTVAGNGYAAGTGSGGFSGDGGAATNAGLNHPYALVIDGSSNLIIMDAGNHRVRKVNASGIINTIAGGGSSTSNGVPATNAVISSSIALAVDGIGNIFIADDVTNKIRMVNTSGIISTIAGTGTSGFSGDGGPATSAKLNSPKGVAVDGIGNVYISDHANDRIRKVDASGIITTIAGNGTPGFSGDGSAATAAQIGYPEDITADGAGNLYMADASLQRIRKISTAGIITTVAGNGNMDFTGDGGEATNAALKYPMGVAVNSSGDIFIADEYNQRIRKVSVESISPIFGANNLCIGSTTDLTDPMAGGAWSSTNTAVAIISSTGTVMPVSPGTTTISYTLSAYCGGASVAHVIRVSPLPDPGSISGGSSVCASSNITLTDAVSGGSWHTSDSTVAAFGSPGILTGITPGLAVITYTVFDLCSEFTTKTVTVLSWPGNILGPDFECSGTPFTLSDPTSGGTWNSSNTTVATIDASTGVVSSLIEGTSVITYSAGGACVATKVIHINTSPAISLGSMPAVCQGTTTANLAYSTTIGSPTYSVSWNDSAQAHGFSGSVPIINTIAGSLTPGDGQPATSISIQSSYFTCDAAGNLYFASQNDRIRMVNTSGILSTIAGNGISGYSGDGGPATAASFNSPIVIAKDTYGNLLIADLSNSVIRKIDPSGIVTTVAGTGTLGYSGDGGPAVLAELRNPIGGAIDAHGNLFVIDESSYVVRKINTSGIISTVAGNGTGGNTGDNGPATDARIIPNGITVDNYDNLFIASGNMVRKVAPSGIITTVGGNDSYGFTGDGGPATDATLMGAASLIVDATGNLYVNDGGNGRIRKINTSGIISTYAGSGDWGFSGDGGPASAAAISQPNKLVNDAAGNMYLSVEQNAIRKIDPTGIITRVVGNYQYKNSGDGGPASAAQLNMATIITTDKAGNLYISDPPNAVVHKINTEGVISMFAGNETPGYSGDNSLAIRATLNYPTGLATDVIGNLFIADDNNNVIRKVNAAGVISTYAGNGMFGYSGDGGPATAAEFNGVDKVATDIYGNLYITDVGNYVVRKVNTAGIISTIAGNGTGGYSGDGGLAISANLGWPTDITFDNLGNLYITDGDNSVVRKVTPSGYISTVAGNGSYGYSGDGGPSTDATLNNPTSIATDVFGNLYISDVSNYVIRKVNPSGIISTFAGDGAPGFRGEGVPATDAGLMVYHGIVSLTTDQDGNLYLSDALNGFVRKVSIISSLPSSPIPLAVPDTATPGTFNGNLTVYHGQCINSYPISVTVSNRPDSGVISGASSLCVGANITLSDTVTSGGVWSSSNAAVANILSDGTVIGVSAGSTVISYTVTNVCGASVSTRTITINPLPIAGTISGSSLVCEGSISTVYDAATGGVWSSSNTTVATIGTSGIISGITPGTTIISYIVTNSCGVASTSNIITINPLPDAGSISGLSVVCEGASISLTDAAAGGVWSASNSNATVSGGVVSGNTPGLDTIYYSVTNSCGTAIASKTVNVNPVPAPGIISGPTSVCMEASITLTDTASGGTWSSSNPSVASVTSGLVSGLSIGTAIISYTVTNSCGTASATYVISVNPLPVAGTISGSSSVGLGATITLTESMSGGTWGVTNSHVSVSGGVVSGLSLGTDTVLYTVTNSCGVAIASKVVTVVNSLTGITGLDTICAGTTTTLSDTGSGVWSSSSPSIATIVAGSGLVTGIYPGETIITYTSSGGFTTMVLTVKTAPGAITGGVSPLCEGATMSYTESTTGGVWSSSDISVATIGGGGTITGVLAGTTIISYSIFSGCSATTVLEVVPAPGPVLGPDMVCVGQSIIMWNSVAGGSWSSSAPSIATVDMSGTVEGLAGDLTANISYTLGDGCMAYKTITVNPLSSIYGATTVCQGQSVYLMNAIAGGLWSSSSSIISVGMATGEVAGVSGGSATVSYTMPSGCMASSVITVYPIGPISGPVSVCVGKSITLIDTTSGGTWSSGSPSVATVSSSGIVTGITGGLTTNISYTTSSGCNENYLVSVNSLAAISGPTSVCQGQYITLTNTASGGTWSSANSTVTVGATTGVVTGVTGGSAIITYTMPSGCDTTTIITINPSTPILGTASLCQWRSVTFTNATSGGTWTSSNIYIAIAGASTGVVTGIATGMATISYSTGLGCLVTYNVSVNPLGGFSGPTSVCQGQNITLTNTASGGIWSSANTTVTVGGSTGIVTGVTGGTAKITYTMPSGCDTTTVITINPSTPILGTASLCQWRLVTFTNATSGGTWTSSNVYLATVGASTGVVTGIATGLATISYSTDQGCVVTYNVTVHQLSGFGGPTSVCQGQTITLTNAASGGTWSCGSSFVSVGATTGNVNGIGTGTATITYTMPSGCDTTTIIRINPSTPITGMASVCQGQPVTYSTSTPGGTWTSSAITIATIGASSGTLSGIAPGLTTISYSSDLGCIVTYNVTVNSLAPIFGSTSVCQGQVINLSDAVGGGTWSSSNSSIATVISSSGSVTGITGGSVVISYVLSTGCTATMAVSVISAPPITGPSQVCRTRPITLADSLSGGTWYSPSSTIATVNATTGVVTGAAAGTAPISYTLVSGCVVVKVITVNPFAEIVSGPLSVCNGLTITLTDPVSGGSWYSSVPSVATMNVSSGVVTGVGTGTTVISYLLPTGCLATTTVTGGAVTPITGPNQVCYGQSITLSDLTPGGTWSSSTISLATIGLSTGILTDIAGGSTGTVNISYTLSSSCRAIKMVSVYPLGLISIPGTTPLCAGATVAATETTSGGTWSTANTSIATAVSTGALTATINGISTGTTLVYYTLPTGCVANTSVLVNPLSPITGPNRVCQGKQITLVDTTVGGTWSSPSNGTSITLTSGGLLTGNYSLGSALISYSLASGCRTTYTVNLLANPAAPPAIVGASSVAISGGGINLTDPTAGGTWSSSNPAKATVGLTTGHVTGVSTGSTVITYTITNAAGCTSIATKAIAVGPSPMPNKISVTKLVIQKGETISLPVNVLEGYWNCEDCDGVVDIDMVKASVTGLSVGESIVSFTSGDLTSANLNIYMITVVNETEGISLTNNAGTIRLIPNPNTGEFFLKGSLKNSDIDNVDVEILDMLGQKVYHNLIIPQAGKINEHISLSPGLANGMYLLNLVAGKHVSVFHFVIER